MKSKKYSRKLIVVLMTFCLLFTTVQHAFADENLKRNSSDIAEGNALPADASARPAASSLLSDMKGHWAEKQVLDWLHSGRIQGYPDDTFKPDQPITRGEFIALVNRSFAFEEKAPVSFTDLQASDWEYEEAAKAVKAGYMEGYPDGTIGLKHLISRLEAAAMIARLLKHDEQVDDTAAAAFRDYEQIAEWGQAAVALVAGKQIMVGYEDQIFRPSAPITRAETVVSLARALLPRSYEKAGLYGPAAGNETVRGDVAVNAGEVTLRNMTITGNLLLAEGIGEGDVTLENVTVQGVTKVNGGGRNSVHFRDSKLGNVIVDKRNGTVRVVLEGSTTVVKLTVISSAILETADLTSQGAAEVQLGEELPADGIVELKGSFEAVNVLAKGIRLEISQGTVKRLHVYEQATGIVLDTGDDAAVILLILDAVIQALGQGRIESVTIAEKANTSVFEKQPLKKNGKGVTSPSPGGNTATPSPGGNTATPSPGGGTATPNPGGSTATPSPGGSTATPSPGGGTATPSPSGGTATPSPGGSTATPSPDGGTATPSPSGGTATPSPSSTPTPDLRIVDNGQGQAVIVIEPSAADQVIAAANTLAEYVNKSTGAALPVLTTTELAAAGSQYDGDVRIYVGSQAPDAQAAVAAEMQGLKDDGFVIHPYEDTIAIVGPTGWGTQFGVNEFLERYFGIRWLMPGPDGEDVPLHTTIDISAESVRIDPATISRSYFYLNTPANMEWGRRNGIHDNIQFHHNLANLFDPTDAELKLHPEYYVDGVLPTHPYEWQPCFNDTTAAVAIGRIKQFFDANPGVSSYSLGINDSENYCAADKLLAGGELNSNGFLNMSEVYYPWVNKIVEGVLADERYEDKYFGLLAYWSVYDPPTTVQLNPRVIPYITDDRMSWEDPTLAAEGMQITEAWEDAAEYVGWYEYLYGSPYNVPRVYMQRMAENYKYAQDHSVIAHVAELFPNFSEGPKPWVSAKLQWNADQDVDDLLNEWYAQAVGVEAAADLKAYYDLWEDFWTTRIFESEWYQRWKQSDPRSNFMRFDQPDYLEAVTKEDITESRRLLEQAVIKAQTSKQKKRAEQLLRGFEFYEASALSYPRTGAVAAPTNGTEALVMLDDIKLSFEMVKKRFVLPSEFEGDPILNIPLAPPKNGGTWDGIQTALITALQSYIAAHPEDTAVSEGLDEFLAFINNTDYSAKAVKTTAGKSRILQSLDFNEGPWRDAEPFSDFMVMGTRIDVPDTTKVYLLWDDVNLYVGYENFDSNIGGMIASDSAPNFWWSSGADDSVETYVTSDPDVSFKGFFSNPKDVRFSYRKIGSGGPAPNAGEVWETNSVKKSDRWNTVQAIPFVSIGIDPNETDALKGFFLRNYHGQKWFLSWGGGYPWQAAYFNPIQLVMPNNLVTDPSFEIGEPNDPVLSANWWYWGADPSNPGKRTSEIKRSGSYSFDAGSPSHAGLVQDVPVSSGKYKFTMYYYVPQGMETTGSIQFWGTVKDQVGGTNLAAAVSDAAPISDSESGWVKFEYDFDIQPDYAGVQPHNLNFTVVVHDLEPGEKLYIDDIAINKLPDYSVHAEPGTVHVLFNNTYVQAPDMSKFTVQQQINGHAATPVTPLALQWDSSTKTASLTVPVIAPSSEQQNVWYLVTYDGGDVAESTPLNIAAEGGVTNLIRNPSFEAGDPNPAMLPNWWYWGANPDDPGKRTTAIKRTGSYSFDAGSPAHAGLVQDVPVSSGKYKFTMYYYVPQGLETTGSIQMWGTIKDQVAGTNLANIVSGAEPISNSSNGSWVKFDYVFDIQPDYAGAQPHNLNLTVVIRDLELGEKLYIDDIAIYKLPEYSVQAEQGTVNVIFDNTLLQQPDINKFTVRQQINGLEAVPVTPSAMTWNAAAQTAALTVPVIPVSSEEQHVAYLVSYDDGTVKESLPFVVAAEGGIINLVLNSSFETGDAGDMSVTPNWWYWGANPDDPGKRTAEIKRSGSYSFDAGSPSHAGLVQDVSVTSGTYKFTLYYYVPVGVETMGTIQLWGAVKDQAGGTTLAAIVSDAAPISSSGNGTWVMFEYDFEIQPDYDGVQPNSLNLTIVLRDLVLGEKLYIDDIAIYRLPD
ncbi:DUF4838 domain-containing protein [Paenibacillus contaminans]|uniref:SLH domain-containing protein n=1 Tax=Paenibacillus contaminans TaxID=450362 RepID=A0A329LZL8_9BACL|nr:DUF4838 domain-containing protein [Paenibacillus contaminans]RAV13319.1 hypothetical protein DQG23_33470 [Paenibacillus contaminans]